MLERVYDVFWFLHGIVCELLIFSIVESVTKEHLSKAVNNNHKQAIWLLECAGLFVLSAALYIYCYIKPYFLFTMACFALIYRIFLHDMVFGYWALRRRLMGDELLGHVRSNEFHSRSYETSSKTTSRKQVSYDGLQDFRVNLDVSHLRPDDLSIKMVDNRVVIEGKHEEKRRKFHRTYDLPPGVDIDKIKSSLSADGILEIHVPKMAVQKPSEKIIPIARTGVKSLPDPGVRRKV